LAFVLGTGALHWSAVSGLCLCLQLQWSTFAGSSLYIALIKPETMLICFIFLFDALFWRRLFCAPRAQPGSPAESEPDADSVVDSERSDNEPVDVCQWMTIFVSVSGRPGLMLFTVTSTTTVWQLKQFLAQKLEALPEEVDLTFGGRPLKNGGMALHEYSVGNGSTLACSGAGDGLLGGAKGEKRKVLPLCNCVFQLAVVVVFI